MASDYLRRLDVQGHLKVKEALAEWDPIGVFHEDPEWPRDEYDFYSGPVVSMLDRGASKEEILGYLRTCCEKSMGVGFDQAKTSRIIDELLAFWPRWKKQLRDSGTSS